MDRAALRRLKSAARGTRMQRRKADRAQRIRARRIWWERNGAFVRGFLVGCVLTGLGAWLLQVVT